MKIEEVIKKIGDLEPLTLLQLIELNNFTSSEKMLIIEEYNNLVKYLLGIIQQSQEYIELK